MKAIKADKAMKTMKLSDEERITTFNIMIQRELDKKIPADNFWTLFSVYLPFTTFGSQYEDIQFITDAGYKITPDYDLERWTVQFYYTPAKPDDREFIHIPSAAETLELMPSIEYRRKCLFQKAVDLEIKKTEPIPFKLCLDFDIYGPSTVDVQFIKDLGYEIDCDGGSRYWLVTLPNITKIDQSALQG